MTDCRGRKRCEPPATPPPPPSSPGSQDDSNSTVQAALHTSLWDQATFQQGHLLALLSPLPSPLSLTFSPLSPYQSYKNPHLRFCIWKIHPKTGIRITRAWKTDFSGGILAVENSATGVLSLAGGRWSFDHLCCIVSSVVTLEGVQVEGGALAGATSLGFEGHTGEVVTPRRTTGIRLLLLTVLWTLKKENNRFRSVHQQFKAECEIPRASLAAFKIILSFYVQRQIEQQTKPRMW